VEVLHRLVGGGAGVGVADDEAERGAGGEAIEEAGEDLDGVGFLALRDEGGLAGAAAVELHLDGVQIETEAGRTAGDHAAHGRAVRFAEGGHAEEGSERARHAGTVAQSAARAVARGRGERAETEPRRPFFVRAAASATVRGAEVQRASATRTTGGLSRWVL